LIKAVVEEEALPPWGRRGFKVKTTAGLRQFDAIGNACGVWNFDENCACGIFFPPAES
jgi:hypothetical protein